MNTQRKRTTRTLYQNAFKDTQNKPTLLEHTTSMLDANTYQDTLQHDFPRTGLPGHTTKTHDQAALRRTHSKTRTTTLPTSTHSRGKPTFEPLRGTHDVNAVRGHTQRHARRNCIQEQTTTHQQFNLKVRRVLTPTWQSSYDPAFEAHHSITQIIPVMVVQALRTSSRMHSCAGGIPAQRCIIHQSGISIYLYSYRTRTDL